MLIKVKSRDMVSFFSHKNTLSCAVGTQLGSILALDGGDSRGEFTLIGHPNVIADNVRSLVQAVHKHIGLAIFGLLIEPCVILAAVTRELINGFEAGCTFIGNGDKVHVFVDLDDHAHLDLVAHL